MNVLEENKIKESQKRVKEYITENRITTKGSKEYVEFFLKNADNSLDSARALFVLSTDQNKKQSLGFTEFNGLLWVVNASYYSMFYITRALLENEGIKIKIDQSIHAVIFDCLVHFFYSTGKLQKNLIEDYADAQENASELLGKQKADELVYDYFHEKGKRGTFTYSMGENIILTKAKTSLERAQNYNKALKMILKKL